MALLLVATIAGAIGSLLFTNAGSAWDNAKKYIETGAHGGRYVDNLNTSTFYDPQRKTEVKNFSGVKMGSWTQTAEVDNPIYLAAVIGDTIGDPLKGVVGPATHALLTTLAALALVLLPFFL